MGEKKEQKKIAFPTKKFNEIKVYSEYSGVPMARILTRLWDKSEERKDFFLEGGKNGSEVIECIKWS